MIKPGSRVLIIDDEKDFLDMAVYWLTARGYAVTACAGAAEAIEQTSKNSFELVFLDVVMPRMDGLETLKQLRKNGVKCPVVLLTTTEPEPSLLIAFQQLGVSGIFKKQASLDVFTEVLEAAIKGRGA